MSDDLPTRSIASSSSASGPAGPLFDGQVGAHYLLTMLAEAEPRGMRGMRLERVELQRAGEGRPLDDIVTRGVTNAGHHTVLEIQVKRTITFSPCDTAFRDVVEQLSRAILCGNRRIGPTHRRVAATFTRRCHEGAVQSGLLAAAAQTADAPARRTAVTALRST